MKKSLFIVLLALMLGALACNRAYSLVGYPTETPSSIADDPAAVRVGPQARVTEACFAGEVWHEAENLCFIEDPQQLAAILPDFHQYMQQDLAEYSPPPNDIVPRTPTLLLSFQVVDNRLLYPEYQPVSQSLRPLQNEAEARRLWRYFAAIIPPDARPHLAEFNLFTDGGEETLASVEQTIDDPNKWALNVDPQDAHDRGDLTLTLVHEYGHLLTLNADQVPPNLELFERPDDERLFNQAEEACPTYFPGEGCAREESYIYAFYREFWADIYDQWLEINQIVDDEEFYAALDDFYLAHQDEFVSDYAVTSLEEDIAESWSYYVLLPLPEGNTRADEKIRFFDRYPELRSLRQEIIARIYSRLIRQQP